MLSRVYNKVYTLYAVQFANQCTKSLEYHINTLAPYLIETGKYARIVRDLVYVKYF